jgi:hypothetical protein
MTTKPPPTPRRARAVCLVAALTALTCAALVAAAVLAHPPAAVLPLVVTVSIGFPVLAAWELPAAIAVLRASRRPEALDWRALAALQRNLDRLPETNHPLGL